MTAFEDALYISTALILTLLVPWGIIVYPAIIQGVIGDWIPLIILQAQGYHWLGFGVGALILVIILIGAWIDQ